MKMLVVGVSKHKGDYEGTPYDFVKIYALAPMEQNENRKGSTAVEIRAVPDVFASFNNVELPITGKHFDVTTELRALGGGNARETITGVLPIK